MSSPPGSAAPDIPYLEQSDLPASSKHTKGKTTLKVVTPRTEQGSYSSAFAASSRAQDGDPNIPQRSEGASTRLWPGGEVRRRVSIVDPAETIDKDGRDTKSLGTPRSASPSLLSALSEFAGTLAPSLRGGDRVDPNSSPDAVDPAASRLNSPRQVPLVSPAVSSSFHKEHFSTATPAAKFQDAANRGTRDRQVSGTRTLSPEKADFTTKIPLPVLPLTVPDSFADLCQRAATGEQQINPEHSTTTGNSSFLSPSVASASTPFGYAGQEENASCVHRNDNLSGTAVASQTPQVSPQFFVAHPPQGTRGRWPMWKVHSLLKKGRSHFMIRRNLRDYFDECVTSLWELLQLSPGERGEEELCSGKKKEPIDYPLRLDKPAGEANEYEEEEEELEDPDSGRMTTSPRRFANDKRERAYVRANHSLFAKRLSGPYRLSMALIAGVTTASAVGALFFGVFSPLVFLRGSFPSVPLSFQVSFPNSLDSPARPFALWVLTWSACLLLVGATLILAYLFCVHAFPRVFPRLASLFPSFSPPPGPLTPSLSPPFFSFEAPFSLSPPSAQFSATTSHATPAADDASVPLAALSLHPAEGYQDAQDAIFASAFLRIYHRCVQGDISGAEALAEEAVVQAQSLKLRQEQEKAAAKKQAVDAGGRFQREAMSGKLSPQGPASFTRALSRAVHENKKFEAFQEKQRRTSEARKAIMCSITNVTLHPSAVSVPSREEEDERRKVRPLLQYESAVQEHVCRGAWLFGAVALSCFLARLLLLVPLHETQLDGLRLREAGDASLSLYQSAASDAVCVLPASSQALFSLATHLTAYAHWLSLEVVPLVLVWQFAAAALLLRPREDSGILQKLMIIACVVCVSCGLAQLVLFDASEKSYLCSGMGLSGRIKAFLSTALCVGIRIFLLCILFVGARVMELHERQLFFLRTLHHSSMNHPDSCPSVSATPSPGVLCATSRTAAAAATVLALAAKRRSL